jgi:hypothetical protein
MKNWKTTVAGLLLAAANLIANGATWRQVLVSLAYAVLGLVAKDCNVTGGTVQQAGAWGDLEHRIR